MFWIGNVRGARSELARRAVSAIFEKMTFRDLTAFFSFLLRENLVFFRYSYLGVLKLICVQILLILIAWILVGVALKKW